MFEDIIIKNGRIIDPANGTDAIGDLCIQKGRVATGAANSHENTLVVDASGCIVTPGLIDMHVHIFQFQGEAGASPDSFASSGVTALVDAGSTGVDTFAVFHDTVLRFSRAHTYAMLHVSAAGLPTERWHENVDPQYFDPERVCELIAEHPGKIVALKIRMSQNIVGSHGYKPLEAALVMAGKTNLPLVVHTPDPPNDAADLVSMLRPGDVYAHAYNPYGSTILSDSGVVKPAFYKARERGVIIDTSSARRFSSFPIVKAALEQGLPPDVISTDITAASQYNLHVHSMPYVMTYFMALGMPLPDVVRAATVTPAAVMGLAGRGGLTPGSVADVAIFRPEERPMVVKDYEGHSATITTWLVPQMTVLRGKVAFRHLCFRAE